MFQFNEEKAKLDATNKKDTAAVLACLDVLSVPALKAQIKLCEQQIENVRKLVQAELIPGA